MPLRSLVELRQRKVRDELQFRVVRMNRSAPDPTALNCPPDLCAFSEFHSTPSEPRHGGQMVLRLVGILAVGLGLAGVVLPLLPSTPFALVATWAFARSSPRLDAWLRAHPALGPPLVAWETRRAIPRPAKAIAVITMPASWIMLQSTGAPTAAIIGGGVIMFVAGVWILSRPS